VLMPRKAERGESVFRRFERCATMGDDVQLEVVSGQWFVISDDSQKRYVAFELKGEK
jgi:hypothetical protein